MKVTRLGIDIAKSVFHLHGVDGLGKLVLRKRCGRTELMKVIANLSPCLIGMEACGSANFWAREFQKHGHTVKLISPQFVKPYVKSNKNDMADAEAICEAVGRPNMRFVPIKSIEHQDIQSLHRIRERLVKSRTALVNEIRGLLAEYGVIGPKGLKRFRKELPELLGKAGERLTNMSQQYFSELVTELHWLDEKVGLFDDKITAVFNNHPVCKRLDGIPGIGPLSATAIVAAVADPSLFKNGRGLSAWFGLVPKQHSTGGKDVLLGISKRGDTYIRKLLIHGARSVLISLGEKQDRRSLWAKKLMERRGMNRAAVALANKNARAIWVLMSRDEEFKNFAVAV
jgi:transposase